MTANDPQYKVSAIVRVTRVHLMAILNVFRHVTPTINDNRKVLTARVTVIAVAKKIFCFRFKMMNHQAIIEWGWG